MDYATIIDSLTAYFIKHPEIKTKQVFEIYNQWAIATSSLLREPSKVQWMLDYIDDLKSIHPAILEDSARKQKSFA